MNKGAVPIVLSLMASCSLATHAAQYRVTDLGAGIYPVAINDSGQVVAHRENEQTGRNEAFVINGLYETPILHPNARWVYVTDINNLGQVVGSGRDSIGRDHAFLWDASTGWQFLLNDSELGSFAWSINNTGVVAVEQNGEGRLLFPNGSITDLGTLGGRYSSPFAVNDSEVVVGLSELSNGFQREFIWSSGEIAELGAAASVTHDFADFSVARDVNNSGDAVGWTRIHTGEYEVSPFGSRRYLYDEYGFVHLNGSTSPTLVPNARFWAVSDDGDALGSRFLVDPQTGPDIWTAVAFRDGQLVDLTSEVIGFAEIHLENAFGSNSRGQILASGWFGGANLRGNPTHGFILTPVPEAASVTLLAVPALGLSLLRREGRS